MVNINLMPKMTVSETTGVSPSTVKVSTCISKPQVSQEVVHHYGPVGGRPVLISSSVAARA